MGFRFDPVRSLGLAAALTVATGAVSSAAVPKPTAAQLAAYRNMALRYHIVAPLKAPFVHRSLDARTFAAVLSSKKTVTAASQVFVSDAADGFVFGFNPTTGALTTANDGFETPVGITVDKSGNLWVVDAQADTISELKPPYTGSPSLTLSDPGFIPTDVAVDPVSGVVAVTNVSTTGGGYGSVRFYKAGATTPTRTILGGTFVAGGFTNFAYCAFDGNGNLFLDGFGTGGGSDIGVVQGELTAFSILELYPIGFPGGVAVFKGTYGDDVAVLDPSDQFVFSFTSPVSSPSFIPFGLAAVTPETSIGLAFNTGATKVWTAGIEATLPPGFVEATEYPEGTTQLYQFNHFVFPFVVAYYPPAIP
jgi:DNA-binding beta-propeller fold protein YncE